MTKLNPAVSVSSYMLRAIHDGAELYRSSIDGKCELFKACKLDSQSSLIHLLTWNGALAKHARRQWGGKNVGKVAALSATCYAEIASETLHQSQVTARMGLLQPFARISYAYCEVRGEI